MSWERGRERVRELIDAGEVEPVTPDLAIARRMLEDAGRHLATASRAKVSGDLSGAYQLAYDALRKSAASLLEAQGLRATSRGGHLAVQEAITSQFGTTVRVFRSFGRVRRARNSFEYPSSDSPGPTSDDIEDAIAVATQAREAATTIFDQGILTRW
ncbi:MAG TPA: HEPN domain-containing protein [Streptosporangiaceae bacterium]|nr:HEPN domain-containing protein [Streptosporangiaceae bacterium]